MSVWISLNNPSQVKPKHYFKSKRPLFQSLLQNQGPSYCENVRNFLLRSVGQMEVLALDVIERKNILNYSAVQISGFA